MPRLQATLAISSTVDNFSARAGGSERGPGSSPVAERTTAGRRRPGRDGGSDDGRAAWSRTGQAVPGACDLEHGSGRPGECLMARASSARVRASGARLTAATGSAAEDGPCVQHPVCLASGEQGREAACELAARRFRRWRGVLTGTALDVAWVLAAEAARGVELFIIVWDGREPAATAGRFAQTVIPTRANSPELLWQQRPAPIRPAENGGKIACTCLY